MTTQDPGKTPRKSVQQPKMTVQFSLVDIWGDSPSERKSSALLLSARLAESSRSPARRTSSEES